MKASLSWICSVLTLHSVSSADEPPSFAKLPNEMQLAIVQRFVVSQKFDFCGYVDWLAVNRWAYPHTNVGMAMLVKVAEEERDLDLEDYKQCSRKQQILKSVRTFVRIRSRLPIVCKTADKEELEHLAQVLESTYREISSFSESPTWKKACMAGLFGRNTLSTLLPYFSNDFLSDSKKIVLKTAFFIGDIDSLEASTKFFGMLKDVPNMVSERDIVFSNSVTFFQELFKLLPNMMDNISDLIRAACSLNCLDILTHLLKVAEFVELEKLDQILDSFSQLKMFNYEMIIFKHSKDKLYYVLVVAAWHGLLPIIQFLWPAMEAMPNNAEAIVKEMMIDAGSNGHHNVLEFFLFESGSFYMQMAQTYVNEAFEGAFGGGNIKIMKFLVGKNKENKPVAPGLSLTKLSSWTLHQAIEINKKWNGLKYLVFLKKFDRRFALFELFDQDNTALCMACEAGDYKLVTYLLRRTNDGKFVFPLTNPAAKDNLPLFAACTSGNINIVEKLLERDTSGNYIYKGIDPSAKDYQGLIDACGRGHFDVVTYLLKIDDGKYVLPRMKGVSLGHALSAAIAWNRIKVVRFLLTMNDSGAYVLSGIKSVDFNRILRHALRSSRIEIARLLLKMEDGKYVLPEMECVDLTRALIEAIEYGSSEIVEFLLSQDDSGYLLPGVKVTEDMLTIPDISLEIRELLEVHLEQRPIDA